MKKWTALLAGVALCAATGCAWSAEVIALDGVSLDSGALDNGCSTETLTAEEVADCRYRVCFSLLKSLWLLEEANRRELAPDQDTMERQQREFEKSHVGEELTFTVLPRVKFQRKAIELYRAKRAENPDYTTDDLWNDVETSAAELEIPERALRALVATYGTDEARFLEFQKMFPDDHESLMERSRNNWEREARRVALEKQICPDDSLTSAELQKAQVEWKQELETAPEATDAMLRDRKREFQVNVYIRDQIRDKAKFSDEQFRQGLLKWIDEKVLGPDKKVFGGPGEG
jgi:hypothetical protein